jgi:hypothetical protein
MPGDRARPVTWQKCSRYCHWSLVLGMVPLVERHMGLGHKQEKHLRSHYYTVQINPPTRLHVWICISNPKMPAVMYQLLTWHCVSTHMEDKSLTGWTNDGEEFLTVPQIILPCNSRLSKLLCFDCFGCFVLATNKTHGLLCFPSIASLVTRPAWGLPMLY